MTRQCGDCQLCCRLVPVAELNKAAGQKCRYQKHGKGCTIYARRPRTCRTWNCQWLVNPDAAGLSRPDRSHYVIDANPDYVTITYNDGQPACHVLVAQIWVDPLYPDAHREPALRAFLLKLGEQGTAAIVRYDERDAFAIFPPNMSADHQWNETPRMRATREKSLVEMLATGETIPFDLAVTKQ